MLVSIGDIDFTQLPEESDKVYVGDCKDDGIVDGLKVEDISITVEIIIIIIINANKILSQTR